MVVSVTDTNNESAFYKSANAGLGWSILNNLHLDTSVVGGMFCKSATEWFATFNGTLYRTIDGTNWGIAAALPVSGSNGFTIGS